MEVSADHGVTKEEARHTVYRELPRLLQRFGGQVSNVRHAWRGDTLEFSFSAAGADIRGSLHVTDRNVAVEVGVPLRFRLFQGMIEKEARAWCDRSFGHRKSAR